MERKIINIENICKDYGGTKVVKNVSFYVRQNEFVTILGPSGCGKTTTLRMIGGFEQSDSGKIFFEEKVINDMPPNERELNTVFQKYALFPHMNIYENIAFGLKIKKTPKDEIEKRVKRMLDLVNLSGYEKRNINSLSGGQQQRIAIARALVNRPKVLLLDEPLGALDLKLRKEMQLELKAMQKELGITFIYVTHDQEEALTMSDTIIVMNEGEIQQIGSPIDIYNEPKNAFVADFIGESNIVDGKMLEDKLVEINGVEFECVDSGFDKNENVDVVIRPEDVKILPEDIGIINGIVTSVIFKGVHYEMTVEANQTEWLVQSTLMEEEGSKVSIKVNPEDIHIMKKG